MAFDKIRAKYGVKPTVEVRQSGGRRVTITTIRREASIADLDREAENELRESGFDPAKLRRIGFNPEYDNPDDIDPDRDLL